jgi:hypothetical protein
MDPIFFSFIKNLPFKEQTTYLLIRAYEHDLQFVHDQCSLTLIRDIYESQIKAIINVQNPIKKLNTKKLNTKKLNSEVEPKITDPFDDKLGTWASDFSEDEIDRMLSLENN